MCCTRTSGHDGIDVKEPAAYDLQQFLGQPVMEACVDALRRGQNSRRCHHEDRDRRETANSVSWSSGPVEHRRCRPDRPAKK